MKSNAEPSTADFAIISGGIMGNATAYFLKAMSPSLSVTVIEPDPTFEFCSTLRASGRVIAELTLCDRFESIGLTRLWYARIVTGDVYREAGIL